VENLCGSTPSFLWGPSIGDAAFAAVASGRESLLRDALPAKPFTPWHEAALLMLQHSLSHAAHCFARIGSVPDQASVGLLVARYGVSREHIDPPMRNAIDLSAKLYASCK
jgi:hypothetical protein